MARKDAEQLRADALLKCAQARRAKETIPDGCEKDGVGEDVLKAALSRNAIFLQTTAEPEPFAVRVLQRTLEDLDDEADEYGSKKELWHMHGARSERYRTVITDMSETHEAMEDYTDFRHGQLVAELGQQRDRLCQLEIMPALYAKGEVEDHPDFTPINVLKDEAFAIHSAMRYHQEFHRAEQRELWKSFYVVRAALDKWQDVSNEPVCPEGTRYFLAHNGTGACANDNCTDPGFVFHRDKLACVNTTCANGTHWEPVFGECRADRPIRLCPCKNHTECNTTALMNCNGTNCSAGVIGQNETKCGEVAVCPCAEVSRCETCPTPRPTDPPQAGLDWWAWRFSRDGPDGLLGFLNGSQNESLEEGLYSLNEVRSEILRQLEWGEGELEWEDVEESRTNLIQEMNHSQAFLKDLDEELQVIKKRREQHQFFVTLLTGNMTSLGKSLSELLRANTTELSGVRYTLQDYLTMVTKDLNVTTNRSREFQFRQGERLLQCFSRKCERLKEQYYKGDSEEAQQNKLSHKAMTAFARTATKIATLASSPGLGAQKLRKTQGKASQSPRENEEEKIRRIEKVLSAVRLQLEERWQP